MRNRFESALPFPAYLETVRRNEELWHGLYDRVRLPAGAVDDARSIPGTWHLLALSEDWCGDAINILPVLARLTEGVDHMDLRILTRDDNLDIMDAHLTNGTSRSIPVVILLDEEYRERGWWGPRPTDLQKWVMEEGMKMDPGPRYARVRRYYARDKGKTILKEVLDLIRSGGTSGTAAR